MKSNQPLSEKEYTVIVGAGLSGLTTAALLSEAGERVLVIEKNKSLGGLAQSYQLDEITFDLGPHLFFFSPEFPVDQFCMNLFAPEELICNRYRWAIQNDVKYWTFPFSPINMILTYPLKYKWEIVQSVLKKLKKSSADKRSLEYALVNKTGPSFYADIFAPLIQKKTGISASQLHKDWSLRPDRDVFNKIKISTGFDQNISFRKKLENLVSPKYYYPKKGFGMIATKLAEQCRSNGVEFISDCTTMSLSHKDGHIQQVHAVGGNFKVKNLIWTAPSNTLHDLLKTNTPRLQYSDLAIVLLTYKKVDSPKRPFVFTYHTEEQYIFNRLYFTDSIFHDSILPDKEGVCAEILLGDELKEKTDAEITEKVITDLEQLSLFSQQDLRHTQVFRLAESMPIYELDYKDAIDTYFESIHNFKNLYAIGRRGGYFFCLTPMAINQGFQMADHLLTQRES